MRDRHFIVCILIITVLAIGFVMAPVYIFECKNVGSVSSWHAF